MPLIRFLSREGSMVPAALLRILLPLIAWSRFAEELLPFRELTLTHMVVSTAFFLSTTWMLVGFGGRTGGVLCAVTLDYMMFVAGRGEMESWGHHHTTTLAYAVTYVALLDNTAALSLDRWLDLRTAPAAPARRGYTWPYALIAAQISTIYFWSGYDKITQGAFVTGDRLIQIFVEVWWTSDWWPSEPVRWLAFAAAWIVILTELALPFALWFRRVQIPAMVAGVVLHGLFYVLLPIGTFSVTMVACYLAFLDPDEVEAFLRRHLGPGAGS